MGLIFEWNKRKAAQNVKKHGVSFDEAKTVFDDESFISVVDDEHSNDEEHYTTIGMSFLARLLMVAHTDREEESVPSVLARQLNMKKISTLELLCLTFVNQSPSILRVRQRTDT